MPYSIVKKEGTDKYFVMNTDTGRLHSKEPLTKEMAKRQLTALNLVHAREAGYDVPPPLEDVKKHKKNDPKKGDIVMSRKDFIEEHRQLISLLSRAGREAEAQRREMNRYI